MATHQIRKAVIPVAGLGTRLLPVTKSVPKELLPLVDTPALQVVVEECIASGIEEVILITGRGKGTIPDHFDHSPELERILEERNKSDELEKVKFISNMIQTVSIRQKEPLGLGHAVLCAREVVGDEHFLVILPDDIIHSKVPAAKQLLDVYKMYGEAVVAIMDVPPRDVDMYGIVTGEVWGPGLLRVRTLEEKPDPERAPSQHAIIGRYILPPVIFDYLDEVKPDKSGEIQLTDALVSLVRDRALIGYEFDGIRHDIGDRLGYITANISYGLQRPNLRQPLLQYIERCLREASTPEPPSTETKLNSITMTGHEDDL